MASFSVNLECRYLLRSGHAGPKIGTTNPVSIGPASPQQLRPPKISKQ
jgi:hypothetical protein